MAATMARLKPLQGGVTHPAVVVEQPMDWALRKGALREVGARRCLLQEDGRCRPACGDATSASWPVRLSKFISFHAFLYGRDELRNTLR